MTANQKSPKYEERRAASRVRNSGSQSESAGADLRGRRAVRIAFTIFGLTLGLSCVLGVLMYRYYQPELASAQDLVIGLGYFMEQHGRFPQSEAEFAQSDFVERSVDGAIRVKARTDSIFRHETHGVEIRDLGRFRIAWGTDLTTLHPDDFGVLYNAKEEKVELLQWPSSPPSGKVYSLELMEMFAKLHELGIASKPASNPASAPASQTQDARP